MPILYGQELPSMIEMYIRNEMGETKLVTTDLNTIAFILGRMRKGYSPIIAICGEQRDGKSTFAVWLGQVIMEAFSKKLDVTRNISYEHDDILSKTNNMRNEVVILDESGYSYYKREWWDFKHHVFAKILITQGRKCLCYIFVSPFLSDIDKAFTKHFDIVLNVKRRGLAKSYRYVKDYKSPKDNNNIEYHLDDIYLRKSDIGVKLLNAYTAKSTEEKNRIEEALANKKRKSKKMLITKVLRGL